MGQMLCGLLEIYDSYQKKTVSVLSILLNISCAFFLLRGVFLPSKPFIKYPPFFLSVTSSVNTCSTVEGDGSKAVLRLRVRRFSRGRLKVGFQTTSMLTANEIVKEQMFQTTSKKIVKPSEKRKPRACVPRTHNIRIEGFMRVTTCSMNYINFIG